MERISCPDSVDPRKVTPQRIRPIVDIVDVADVHFSIATCISALEMTSTQYCTGATHQHTMPLVIRLPRLKSLPPLPVQRRIAGILSAYDELIENSQRRIRILGGDGPRPLPRVVRPLPLPRPRKPPARRLPPRRHPPRLGREIRRPCDDRARRDKSVRVPRCRTFEHFSLPAFDNGREPAIEVGATILSGKYFIDDSTVLLSKLNPRIPRIWLPMPSGKRRAITSTEFLGLKPKPGITREFIYAKCCSDDFASQFAAWRSALRPVTSV